MTEAQLQRALSAFGKPSRLQVSALVRLTALYAAHGLIRRGEALPLWRCCPHAAACWTGADCEKSLPGQLALPWVGRRYRPGKGVVVLGINHNNASGLPVAFEIAAGDFDAFSQGYKRVTYDCEGYRGTDYAYRSTLAAAAVREALGGSPISHDVSPERLVPVLDEIARVQAIKCSPATPRGTPAAAMWERCPPMLLEQELDILRPAAILGFGSDVRWTLEQLDGYESVGRGRSPLAAARIPVGGRSVPVLMLAHPAAPAYWGPSYRALVRALRNRTLNLDPG